MTKPETQQRDDALQRTQKLIAKSRPEQILRLLADIRKDHPTNKDLTDTLH